MLDDSSMILLKRMIFYRILFSLAALYNLAFGLWAGFFPNQFVDLFDLGRPQYPSLWACLGMVVGLYGLVYAYVAKNIEDGDVLIAIGLLGKLLGPIGWLQTTAGGELPHRTFFLILCNDLIWWFPFLFYLLREHPLRGRIITALMVVVHVIACFGLIWIRGGLEFTPDLAERFRWLQANETKWVLVWWFWTVSTLSLPAFLASWILQLRNRYKAPNWAWGALAICLVGTLCDVSGEAIYVAWITHPARSFEGFQWGIKAYYVLSAAIANGLYCIAGFILSYLSVRAKFLKGFVSLFGFAMWVVGLSLTVFAFRFHPKGVLIAGGLTMVMFLPWAAWVGWKFRMDRPAIAARVET